jgi:hypothetical protein
MNAPDASVPAVPSRTNERKIVWLLCLLAAVHVFVFSATFPFFNNVDEVAHFDLVVRYSNGAIPHTIDTNYPEAFPYIVIFASVEYLCPPAVFADTKMPPPTWTLPMKTAAPILLSRQAAWSKGRNHEVAQPPLYYALAGLWWRSAKALGFHDGFLLYSVRFLNVFFVGILVWLSYLTARLVFPENQFVRLGVPGLLAFIPQTVFYSIQNDVLSPISFSAAFLCLLKLLHTESPGLRLGIFTGLALAATFLTKLSNLPLLAVSAAVILIKIMQLARAGKLRTAFPSLAALALCAGLPMVGWLAWCKHSYGDFTGNAQKIQFLGWTQKPFAEWWDHPIFSPHGLGTFFSGLMASFWRGEFVWHCQRLALPAVDMVYVFSSVILVGIALLNLLRRNKGTTTLQRQALWCGLWCFAAAIAFLGFLSIIYDFHNCFYPSREYPYFTSGRLMLGVLVPFLLLFVYGLDCALKKLSDFVKFVILAAFILFMLATEITVDWPIFPNPYNWFHM